ncbi:lytic transglycosylase domain-containing protein [Mycolicibacterium austroafricanum]|uniref:lytic transglycosylase domain-containing protein n=1 Tax=Mycolicibacterium austroafricanum TaxID=39687 RepID=UPI001CA30738|nr:lytic transglycosylase domain-containing protein [Mycolicibacterium austroafricanum]QZT55527.1 lytic transglycosylase domain-containing protein [Mycolicibacterium austroafricanum]
MSCNRVGGLAALIACLLVGCSSPTTPSTGDTAAATTGAGALTSARPTPAPAPAAPATAQPALESDPARIVDDLTADEQTLRAPGAPEAALVAAARRQQKAYRVLARHPEWDAVVRPRVPRPLLDVYDRNVDARRQLGAMSRGKVALPAWRVERPPAADQLLGFYRKAEAASGVSWNYLAAINFVETAFGRITGVSTAGAQGPMQFMPSTFAAYGAGTDIHSPHDSIMAAGRFLAAHGFARDRDQAIYRYNNSRQYVRAINQYATLIAADPAAFSGYYRWDVYYNSTAGDVILPVGYASTTQIPVEEYLKTHPQ